MEKNNGQQPAFPTLEQTGNPECWNTVAGLTKREYFAAMAMQGLLASWNRESMPEEHGIEIAVKISVDIADALLTQLNNTK